MKEMFNMTADSAEKTVCKKQEAADCMARITRVSARILSIKTMKDSSNMSARNAHSLLCQDTRWRCAY